ncbi:unnamed protein product [Mycena citricolor]|uniref:Uncharacterized protein n=1 Tax=Mycena citricolor TaxID=2018698 RepID=A0AAD2HD94_9AGAR|nr:unnamed protein product [Mycena citricolor]
MTLRYLIGSHERRRGSGRSYGIRHRYDPLQCRLIEGRDEVRGGRHEFRRVAVVRDREDRNPGLIVRLSNGGGFRDIGSFGGIDAGKTTKPWINPLRLEFITLEQG